MQIKCQLELYNNTVISVDKNSNAQYAKIFVWINDMQPITNCGRNIAYQLTKSMYKYSQGGNFK